MEFEKYSLSPGILAKMYLGCSDISATNNKKWKWRSKKYSYLQKQCTDIAETWCRLRLHVYQGLNFFRSSCVLSSWNNTTCKSFVAKVTYCNSPFWCIKMCQEWTNLIPIRISLANLHTLFYRLVKKCFVYGEMFVWFYFCRATKECVKLFITWKLITNP